MLSGAAGSGSSGAGQGTASGSSRSGAGSADRRPASQVAADNSISTAVRSRFVANPALKPLNLTVDTHDGVVTLRGQVNKVELRNAAQDEARAVKGVRAVQNQVTVR